MTVNQYKAAFRGDTKTKEKTFPSARILALLNEAQADFVDRSLCLKTAPVSRLTMVTVQSYSITGDRGYLDAASGYKWTDSVATPGEYHCELVAGGDPVISEPDGVHMDGADLTEGTLGSLADHEYAYGDNDTLGYDTPYIADASGDPDTTGAVILLEPGGFGIDNMLRIVHFRYDGVDITDMEVGLNEIGIGASTKSKQSWAFWDGTVYLDPISTASKTIQIWLAKVPTVLTTGSDSPEIDGVYHSALLCYIKWKYYDGLGDDVKLAKDNERMYRKSTEWAYERSQYRARTGRGRIRKVFP